MIANLEVATGQVIAPSLGPTRTEEDTVTHVCQTIATDPDAGWIFLADQLNTHQSEGLVRLVAEACHIDTDLGVRGKSGVLQSMETEKHSWKMKATESEVHRLLHPHDSQAVQMDIRRPSADRLNYRRI